jgi:hypothetical protein
MQKYVTPAPGRTPRGNIINRADYRLDIQLQEFRASEYMLTIEKFIPETGWTRQQFFLTPDELDLVRQQINGSS